MIAVGFVSGSLPVNRQLEGHVKLEPGKATGICIKALSFCKRASRFNQQQSVTCKRLNFSHNSYVQYLNVVALSGCKYDQAPKSVRVPDR